MKYYVKKPIPVAAVKVEPENREEIIALLKSGITDWHETDVGFVVNSWEGMQPVVYGSDYYIIKGVQGECYPCDGSVFRSTYERVDGDELSVGDYLWTQEYGGYPVIATVASVNKNNYRITTLSGTTYRITKDTMKTVGLYGRGESWQRITEKGAIGEMIAILEKYDASEKARKFMKSAKELNEDTKKLVGKAKYFLTQIEDVPEVDVIEEDE